MSMAVLAYVGVMLAIVLATLTVPRIARQIESEATRVRPKQPQPKREPMSAVRVLDESEANHARQQHQPHRTEPRPADGESSVGDDSSNVGIPHRGVAQHRSPFGDDGTARPMGGELPRRRNATVTGMAMSIEHLERVTRGNAWRRLTPPEVTEAIDEVLRTWRAAHR